MHVGTFTPAGTFDAAIERLGHLVELGVDAVELLPVAEFDGDRGWGYDGVNLYAPHHAYGEPDGLKRFVDACHSVGVGVVMDVVYNHFGPVGNHLAEFGPYLSDTHRTNWGAAVNLDGPDSDEVRRYFIDNALMWLRDYHCDGIRLDAVHALVDDSAVHLIEQLTQEISAYSAHLRRPVFVICESDLNDPRFVRARSAGGYGANAAWADEWHHAVHAATTGESDGYYEDFGSLELLAKALGQAWVYDGIWSVHRSRTHGRSPDGLTGDQFVVSLQNHDQIGNRAAGDRLSNLVSPARLRVAATLLLSSPFTPMLFQGEEWGASTPWQYFTDIGDPDVARSVTDGRRREFASFGWRPEDVPDPQDPATFERSKLDWDELAEPGHRAVFDWYRLLVQVRQRIPELTDGRLDRVKVDLDQSAGGLTVTRGPVVVAVNLGPQRWRTGVDRQLRLLAASTQGVTFAAGEVELPPDSAVVLAVDGLVTAAALRPDRLG
jgi:maltooligosyltrehalose trehalohydrolase